MNKPPATPGELNVPATIYKRVVSGREPSSGRKVYSYAARRNIKIKIKRQRSDTDVIAHTEMGTFQSVLVGNWWSFLDVLDTDIIVYGAQDIQAGFKGPIVNWEERNRWAIGELVAVRECLEEQGIHSCECSESDPPTSTDWTTTTTTTPAPVTTTTTTTAAPTTTTTTTTPEAEPEP